MVTVSVATGKAPAAAIIDDMVLNTETLECVMHLVVGWIDRSKNIGRQLNFIIGRRAAAYISRHIQAAQTLSSLLLVPEICERNRCAQELGFHTSGKC